MSSPAAEGQPPTVYIFYGDDEFAMTEAVAELRGRFSESAAAELNTEHFDGRQLELARLEEVCLSAPFLAERRLVIVDNTDQLTRRKEPRQRLLALLDQLPPSTALVLLVPVDLQRKSALSRFQSRSELLAWAEDPAHQDSAYVQACVRRSGSAFVRWVRQRAAHYDGDIEAAAAQLLAETVADEPRLADQEIRKLLDYVDRSRPISRADVERLTPLYGQSDVFAMVDAVGHRDARRALTHLHELLRDEDPRYAFAMIVRQFRLLLQAREALDAGLDPVEAMDEHPFVAGKARDQARNFSLADLERVYHQLYALDLDSKTGKALLTPALDELIVQLAR
ncbi:MAG: DNA polymerase III subunit delta [Anaerolineales bacterium]|nr:DNA polymerase III subunit delta [Anaerolineales bacterium]